MNDADTLAAAIARCFGEPVVGSMRALGDEKTARSWLVGLGNTHIVAKLPERHGGLTAGTEIEYEILVRAAEAGVAPQPLGRDETTGMLFVEHVADAPELDPKTAMHSAVLERIAGTLRALNALEAPPALRAFDPLHFADVYASATRSTATNALQEEIADLHAICADVVSGASLCHNDLHSANILAGERVLFVDFEYAVRAAPIVDIASYAAFNDLDESSALYLARRCLGEALPFTSEQLGAVIRIQQLLGRLWEIARNDNNAPS